MARVRVSIVINSSPAAVWDEIRRIERHVDWMAEAHEIRFLTPSTDGVGASFECITRIGPFRVRDRMTVAGWREGRELAIRHRGPISGTGRFTLSRIRGDRTRLTWIERFRFPWWLGGPVGAFVGAFVLRRLLRRNLRVVKALVESGRDERSGVVG